MEEDDVVNEEAGVVSMKREQVVALTVILRTEGGRRKRKAYSHRTNKQSTELESSVSEEAECQKKKRETPSVSPDSLNNAGQSSRFQTLKVQKQFYEMSFTTGERISR